jgi:hypothetical protein
LSGRCWVTEAWCPPELDGQVLHVGPGAVGIHQRVDLPGREAWEGGAWATLSRIRTATSRPIKRFRQEAPTDSGNVWGLWGAAGVGEGR